MKDKLAIAAHKFCSEHFCDLSLDQTAFLLKIDALLADIDSLDNKLLLINEIIRISKLYYCSDYHGISGHSNQSLINGILSRCLQ